MNLDLFPRVRVAHLPTPLERLDNLSRVLGGPEIWIKRDDCTGLSTGGNKTRKLEFLMAEACDQGANIVLTQGATQSNHARQTAAFAARMGLACHILLEDRTGKNDPDYRRNGNVLLDRLHGATIQHYPPNLDMNAVMERVAEGMRAEGRKAYTIPGGGSNSTGALGYVNAGIELMVQAHDMGVRIDHVVHATGSAGTQAGLAVGLRSMGVGVELLGIGVNAPKEKQEVKVFELARSTAEKTGCATLVRRGDIVANCDYVGEGYGIPTPATIDAIKMLARLEGILLDPVYSGKAMAGLIDLCRRGHFTRGQRIVFVHTGGAPGLFAYLDALRVDAP